MDFTDRQREMARLDKLARSPKAGVAVIWGRRRVGKTRLLLEWTNHHKGVYYVADESSPAIQRKYFSLAIAEKLPRFADVDYPDWQALLNRLAEDAQKAQWRGPIVIDELPYLITSSPEFASVLQKFIDHKAKKADLLIALCGSSQRMMQGAVLDASAPLYGRADEVMRLQPIPIGYIEEALKLKNARECVETYAVWGGIPRYWELVERSEEAYFETIAQLVFDPIGPLYDEPQRLLLEESPSAMHLRPILDAIGLGAHRFSEVAARIEQPVTAFTRSVQKLIELDLIQRDIPFGASPATSRKTLYKIKDPFMRFWFEVVAPRRSTLSQSLSSIRKQHLENTLPRLYAMIWEELCRAALPLLSQTTEKIYEEAARYWDKQGFEWDIVSRSEDHSILFLGEAKWTTKTPSNHWIGRTIQELRNKGIPPIKRNSHFTVEYGLFIPEKPHGLKLPSDVKVYDANDVINVLR